MDTFKRLKHINLIIVGNSLDFLNDCINSLVYSTHLNLFIFTTTKETRFLNIHRYNTTIYQLKNNNLINSEIKKLCINTKFDGYLVDNHFKNLKILNLSCLNYPSNLSYFNNFINKNLKNKFKNENQVLIFKNFRNEIKILSTISNKTLNILPKFKCEDYTLRDNWKIICLEVKNNEIILNLFNLSIFKKLRMHGINYLLSVVQDLLLRDQIFLELVDIKFINYNNLKYTFKPTNFFFDLDETLIINGKPLHESIKFLNEFSKILIFF